MQLCTAWHKILINGHMEKFDDRTTDYHTNFSLRNGYMIVEWNNMCHQNFAPYSI